MGEAVRAKGVTFFCSERGCDFEPTQDEAAANIHTGEFGHRVKASSADPRDVRGEWQRDRYLSRVEVLMERLPAPPAEWVVFDASEPGVNLIDVIEATADLDIVRAHDRYVRLPRGYATVHFLRQFFAVVRG